MGHMRIGELAKATETSVETLRYYEAEGLVPRPSRSESGYRLYKEKDVQRILFIRRARAMGFSLKEVSELLTLEVDKEVSTCGEVKLLAEQKLNDIDEKIAELKKMKLALKQITEACQGGSVPADQCTILEALAS